MSRIHVYDTTLRDGSQGEGVNFSLQDKLQITRRLDELGVDFIEGGYPLSNPKDFEYFQEVRKLPLRHARVAAFGMTSRKGVAPDEDTCLKALVDSGAPVVTIVGKTSDLHVREVLRSDELGVDFIEGGYPLSNPKDFEYFQEVRKLPLRHARVAAFGMTSRKGVAPDEDTCLKALVDSGAPVVTIVGKTSDLHVREVL